MEKREVYVVKSEWKVDGVTEHQINGIFYHYDAAKEKMNSIINAIREDNDWNNPSHEISEEYETDGYMLEVNDYEEWIECKIESHDIN